MLPRNSLLFEQHGGRTVLRKALATSPLRLLTPRNHGKGAWVVAATLGGGLVDGDSIMLDVDVGPRAIALLGTQASTKVYRCPKAACRQELVARVGADALLVSIPDPVVCFKGARYEQSVSVDMAESSSLVHVDAFTSGRNAHGERWEFLHYRTGLRVIRQGTPFLWDAIVLDPAHGDLARRMGRFNAFATLVVLGPLFKSMGDAALRVKPPERDAALVTSASPLGDDGALVRIAGVSAEAVTIELRGRLGALGKVLGDDPFARKW